MAPRSPLGTAPRSSLTQPYPGSSGAQRALPGERRSVRERSNDNFPAAGESWPRKKSLSTRNCSADTHSVPGESSVPENDGRTGIASEMGG